MMTLTLLAIIGQGPIVPSKNLDSEQFVRIIDGLQANILDLSLTFEGEFRFVGPKRLMPDEPNPLDQRYQGNYVYRNDGATFLEVYRQGFAMDTPFIHSTSALLRGQLDQLVRNPDNFTRNPPPIKTTKGVTSGSGVFDQTASPERIIFLWYFRSLASSQPMAFEDLGWQDVEGHKCIVIRIDSFPDYKGEDKRTAKYWVDLDRGGHPLKVDEFAGDRLLARRRDIRLDSYPTADGKQVWFPSSGINESFRWRSDYYDRPIFQETYKILGSSLRINERPTDKRFSVRWKEGGQIKATMPLRREFESVISRPPPSLFRTDPAGVQLQLDRHLEAANKQGKMLEASSASRETWNWTTRFQFIFGFVGIAVIASAIIMMRRSR